MNRSPKKDTLGEGGREQTRKGTMGGHWNELPQQVT